MSDLETGVKRAVLVTEWKISSKKPSGMVSEEDLGQLIRAYSMKDFKSILVLTDGLCWDV